MRRYLTAGSLALLAAAGVNAQLQPIQARPAQPVVSSDRAVRIWAYTGPTARQKSMLCPLVISGKVTIEKEPVDLQMYQGQQMKSAHKVAKIQVTSTLLGEKAGDVVTVLIPPADPSQIGIESMGQPQQNVQHQQNITPPIGTIQLMSGQEGVFFLYPHPMESGKYMIQSGHTPLNPLDTNYKADLAKITRISEIYAEPTKLLKSEKAEDRFEAAAALVFKYRRQTPQPLNHPMQQEAIPLEESQLILKAVLETDWAKYDQPVTSNDPQHDYTQMPVSILNMLAIYPGQSGFPQVQVKPGQGYNVAYQESLKSWLEGPGAKYEIKKFVPKK
jgi:hypothetical protein